MVVNSTGTQVQWGDLFNRLSELSGAEATQKTDEGQSVTFTTLSYGGMVKTMTLNIPDDLDLPDAVTPEAIDTLIEKLAEGDFGLTANDLAMLKTEIKCVYAGMAGALRQVQSGSTGQVLFDLYQLMALLVEVAQSQRNAARDLRTAQNQQIQNSIQSQADAQRAAAMTGLIVGITCGAVSALVSVGMLVGQGAAYKSQLSAAKTAGVDAAQSNVTMVKGADTPEHAQAQMAKVAHKVGQDTATTVTNDINEQVLPQKTAFDQARANVAEKQELYDTANAKNTEAQNDLAAKTRTLETEQTACDKARADANIPKDKPAAEAKQEYEQHCKETSTEPDKTTLEKYDTAIAAEKRLESAKSAHQDATSVAAQKTEALNGARDELAGAKADFEKARVEYRAALKTAVEGYEDKYEGAMSRGASSADVKQAKNNMDMARAYAYNEMAKSDVSTAVDHHSDVAAAKTNADDAAKRLTGNKDYSGALRRIETFTAINAINTAVGNMLQSMTQNITSMINAEATRKGAEQQEGQEQLDQSKDLFNQAQNLVNAAVQLMQAVRSAETQSMRDAIQA